jgi:hypothetical protein
MITSAVEVLPEPGRADTTTFSVRQSFAIFSWSSEGVNGGFFSCRWSKA